MSIKKILDEKGDEKNVWNEPMKPKRVGSPNWGGKREGSGRKNDLDPSGVSKVFDGKVFLKIPESLDSAGRAEWKKLMRFYASQDRVYLKVMDMDSLETYCTAYSMMMSAKEEWKKEYCGKMTSDDKDERDAISLLFKTMKEQTRTMNQLAPLLYLTPKSREKKEQGGSAGDDLSEQLAQFNKNFE